MFIDSVKIKVRAGKGGDGIVAFRREKYVPKGGPSGGKGGNGGSIYFIGEAGLTTLLDLRFKKKITAENGQNGMNKDMYGSNGNDTYVKVPLGTTIIDDDTNLVLGDITVSGQRALIARGGKGGRGNSFFANARTPAPDFAEKGELGDEINLRLDLKVLADVGLVGFPSVGKSTLISVVSAARPKIADYPFTTLIPNLGVVSVPDGRSFIMADMPGLIEGAHLGAGLGIQFLKHIERTRVIVHIVDMGSTEDRDPIDDYEKINKELEQFDESLLKRPQIVVASKMDLTNASENLNKFMKAYPDLEIIPISSVTRQNLDQLLYKIADLIDYAKKNNPIEENLEEVVEYNYVPPVAPFNIELTDDGVYNITGTELKKLFDKTNFDNDANARLFAQKIRKMGVDDALRKIGVKNGDIVRIFDYEFEFID